MRTMAKVSVRRALSAETDEIRAANLPFAERSPAAFYDPCLDSALDVPGRMATGTVLAATIDDRVVGTVTYFRDANDEGMPKPMPTGTAGLRATAVDPGWQGQGIGRALVDAVIQRAIWDGAASVALHTATFMTEAIALYERAGFTRVLAFDWPTEAFFPGPAPTGIHALCYVRSVGQGMHPLIRPIGTTSGARLDRLDAVHGPAGDPRRVTRLDPTALAASIARLWPRASTTSSSAAAPRAASSRTD